MENQHRTDERLQWTREVLGDPALVLEPASSDASFRSYWRTQHEQRSWIVMDSPPAQEDPKPWVELAAVLAKAGLHVPIIAASDLEQGFLLIEDLGSKLYLSELTPETADPLYHDAMHALLRIQSAADTSTLQPYDATFLRRELEIMPEWFLAHHLGRSPDPLERHILDEAYNELIDSALEQPQCFVHRDFHSRNLLVIEDNGSSPPSSVMPNPGIIDFQGALLGPITYDLASLLRDCYIVWEDERVRAWAEQYRTHLQAAQLIDASVDHDRFMRWFDLIGLQRHIKVLGIFCRLYYRDGKQGYLGELPRVYDYIISVASRYPEMSDFVLLLRTHVGSRDLRMASPA